ncbi:hypothetical protein [Microbulbifer agarilyticus]|uniref:hypothetical protein n=1 Tax=Microbulbifer agarilyticus TaxID=260552 RepID=UPI001CD5A263|nr:hypothetical protein [Microbulbifer agarilyticus]MCA0899068.1 hypothetical protein [Microbulbifer agarilyticus]
MATRPESGVGRRRTSIRILAWTLPVQLVMLPFAFANEPLDEDFLLFLSDWTDETGEFIAPSEVEDVLEKQPAPPKSEVVDLGGGREQSEQREQGERNE